MCCRIIGIVSPECPVAGLRPELKPRIRVLRSGHHYPEGNKMDNEIISELIESTKLLAEMVKIQHQLIHEQLMPCFSIMTALVKNLPSEEQKNLLAKLQYVAENIEPLAQAENIECSYSKAAKIVSEIVSGGAGDISAVQRLQLIPGGKKDAPPFFCQPEEENEV